MRPPVTIAALFACCAVIGAGGFIPPPAWADAPSRAAPDMLLAEEFDADVDPAHYWISEKLDGVRALWDGRELRFRSGRKVPAPDWFIAGLPAQPLDGELWLGRGRFDELSGIVRTTQPDDDDWRRVSFMIFELPGAAGSFTQRAERIRQIAASAGVPWLQPVRQFRVADRGALMQQFDAVVRAGGEGLMLHRADAPYRTGRSDDLLKLKPRRDAEATVIGHEPGKGRLAGLTGALRMRTPAGKEFRVGSGLSDAERRHPPALS